MAQVLKLADCDTDFLTRGQGERIRARLVDLYHELKPGERLVIDLSGVDVLTPSFADECLGKLAEVVGMSNFGSSVSLVGANETVRVLLNSVLSRRLTDTSVTPSKGKTQRRNSG
jgi:hypothetical protein